jgi:hypothetical protein
LKYCLTKNVFRILIDPFSRLSPKEPIKLIPQLSSYFKILIQARSVPSGSGQSFPFLTKDSIALVPDLFTCIFLVINALWEETALICDKRLVSEQTYNR